MCGEAIGRRVSRKTRAGAEALTGADGAGPFSQVLWVQPISVRAVFGPVEEGGRMG